MNTPDKLRGEKTGMGTTVKTVTRWLKGPILLFGIYLVMYGHVTPGGGFGGGVVIACAFILITLATGESAALHLFSRGVMSRLDSVGLLAFLALGWLGTGLAGAYFYSNFINTPEAAQFTLLSGGIMPMANIALGLKVASALFLVFTLLTAFHIAGTEVNDPSGPEKQQEEDEP